jgi:hypothetical protein
MKHHYKAGLRSPYLLTRLVHYLAALWHILSPSLAPAASEVCDEDFEEEQARERRDGVSRGAWIERRPHDWHRTEDILQRFERQPSIAYPRPASTLSANGLTVPFGGLPRDLSDDGRLQHWGAGVRVRR